jgi:hypothetical protein
VLFDKGTLYIYIVYIICIYVYILITACDKDKQVINHMIHVRVKSFATEITSSVVPWMGTLTRRTFQFRSIDSVMVSSCLLVLGAWELIRTSNGTGEANLISS